MRPAGPDRRLRLALRLLIESRHVGREHAATWETLREELEAEGLFVKAVRRLQEAASYLRRVDKVAIGADSMAGVYLVIDDDERKRTAGERVKRIRAEVEELAAFDRAMYERIALAFDDIGGKAA